VVEVSDEQFEQMVEQGADALPDRFAKYIENVAITWADEPDVWQRMKARLRRGGLLLGLYEGIPKTKRGNNYSLVLPDKITIFKQPLQHIAKDEIHLADLVKDTVWHEVAHHFGLSDEEIHVLENKLKKP
jgi:predicted Zn-dependent protease with MMP-like domain